MFSPKTFLYLYEMYYICPKIHTITKDIINKLKYLNLMKQIYLKFSMLLLCLVVGLSAWGETVTYTVSSITEVSTSGTAPNGSSATYSSTYSNKCQLTSGKVMTLTLSGFSGQKITSIKLSMKSNSSAGAGYLDVKAGSTTLASIGASTSGVAFNNKSWNGSYTTTYTDVAPVMNNDSYVVQNGENVVIIIGATTNSLYCQSFKISYEDAGAANIESISIKSAPAKTVYMVGECFNPLGLIITKNMSDNSTEDVEYAGHESDFLFSPTLEEELTNQTKVTIGYRGNNVEQGITLIPFVPNAGTYVININNDLYGVGIGNSENEQCVVKNGVTVISGCTSGASTKTYYDAAHIRYYNNSYLKLTAPEGFVITKVVFVEPESEKKWNDAINPNVGTYTKSIKTWTGSATNIDFKFTAQCRIGSIKVTYDEGSDVHEPENTLQSISVSGTPSEFWKGDTFNHDGMTVTASYSDESTANITDVASFSVPDMATSGEKIVTVTYQGKEDSYTINVKTIANTQETAYTVTEAKALIDAGKDLNTEVYVKGTVSKVDKYNESYNSITYWLDDDAFEVYSGKGLNNTDFNSFYDISVDAEVIIYGVIKKYNTTYEFDKNNYLVEYSYTAPVLETYIVTLNSCGNTINGESVIEVEEGNSIDLPQASTTATGFVFKGWSTTEQKDETNALPTLVNNSYSPTADITLYPIFEKTETTGGQTVENVWRAAELGEITSSTEVLIVSGNRWIKGSQNTSYINGPEIKGGNTLNLDGTITEGSDINDFKWYMTNYDEGGWAFTSYSGKNLFNFGISGNSYARWNLASSGNKSYSMEWMGNGHPYEKKGEYLVRDGDNFKMSSEAIGNIQFYIEDVIEVGGTTTYTYTSYPLGECATLSFIAKNEDGYWATFSNTRNVVIPEMTEIDGEYAQVTAYTVMSIGGELEFNDISEDCNDGENWYLPANTGYLLKCEFTGDVAPSVVYTYENESIGEIDSEINMLRPAAEEMTGDCKFYKLTYKGGKNLGFYYGATGGAAFSGLKENTAYLAVPSDMQIKSFVLSDMATAIKSISSKNFDSNAPIYNVAGQRVNSNAKGILIQNGKKFYNK